MLIRWKTWLGLLKKWGNSMPFFSYKGIKIAAVAAAVPKERVSVDSFKAQYGEEVVNRFSSMTGIKEFRKTKPHQTASDLGYVAAQKIIAENAIDRDTIGALVFVAHSTDYRRPATACVLHKRLGLSKDCAAYDISLGCSATAYGMQAVCSMMANSDIQRGLLIVGETLTKMVNPQDRSVNMLFGDCGAAMLFERTSDNSEINIILKTDGNGYKAIIAPAGGFRNMDAPHENMLWPDGNIRSLYNTYMNGTDVFSFSISDVPKTVKEFFGKTETSPDNYDCFAFHQANQYIHKQLSKKLKIPIDKMPMCLDRYGNPSAPAPFLVLCDVYGDKDIGKINTLFCCFGVGLSWGVASAVVDTEKVYSVIETDEIFKEGIINEPF